jgi:exodeoxyribonuclease-5
VQGHWNRGWRDPVGRLVLDEAASKEHYIYSGAQVICGFNSTRREINRAIRERRGAKGPLPTPGEPLICLRNNNVYEVFNGEIVTCLDVLHEGRSVIEVEVRFDDGTVTRLPMLKCQFGVDEIKSHRDEAVCHFDYGACITAHKSQGSEFREVVVIEEIDLRWNARRWRYTAATRARERLVYCARW